MAIQCKYCGATLPKDDARFCNKCGMLVPSHPFSPQSLSASKRSASREAQEGQKRVLHEQVAELSPSGSKPPALELEKSVSKPDVPDQEPLEHDNSSARASAMVEERLMDKLPETPQPELEGDVVAQSKEAPEQISSVALRRKESVRRRMPQSAQARGAAIDWPSPVTHVAAKEPLVPEKGLQEQDEESSARSFEDKVVTGDELHGDKVGTEEVFRSVPVEAAAVEDVPTQEVNTPVENVPTQEVKAAVEDLPTRVMPAPVKRSSQAAEPVIENLPTNKPFLAVPPTQEVAQAKFVEDWRVRANKTSEKGAPPQAAPLQTSASSLGNPSTGVPGGIMDRGEIAPSARRARKVWPVVLIFFILVVLVAGGLVAAMLLSQSSGNDAVVQAQVSFRNTQLGLSLLYPNGWIKQVTGSTADFYANNHVGEVDIMEIAGNENVTQVLQQQATKMGISGKKTGETLNFAGASWQQLQGTVQVSGASYTDTILATLHGNQLFMMVQHAPQSNYADWEQEFFAPLRASLKFL